MPWQLCLLCSRSLPKIRGWRFCRFGPFAVCCCSLPCTYMHHHHHYFMCISQEISSIRFEAEYNEMTGCLKGSTLNKLVTYSLEAILKVCHAKFGNSWDDSSSPVTRWSQITDPLKYVINYWHPNTERDLLGEHSRPTNEWMRKSWINVSIILGMC